MPPRDDTERSGLFYAESDELRPIRFDERWSEIRDIGDFRPDDHVLDVGCAEGLITLEIAALVERVDGFEVKEVRIAEAKRLATERGITNAHFAVVSVDTHPFEPASYDVILFMDVWGKELGDGRTVGAEHLARILDAARRQVIFRAGVQGDPERERRLPEVLSVCDEHGFDALAFSRRRHKGGRTRNSLVIANRRGTDARSGVLPRIVLIPTAQLADHPVVRASAGWDE
jgi:SAM-dependent methyltransferase